MLIRNLNHMNLWMTQLFHTQTVATECGNSDSVGPPCQACGVLVAESLWVEVCHAKCVSVNIELHAC